MGEESTRESQQFTGKDSGGTHPAGTPAPAPRRPEPAPGNPRPGTPSTPGTGTGGTAGTPAGGKTPQKEKPAELVAVSEPAPTPEPPKKKQTRQRKPRAKKADSGFSSEQISALLISMSAIVAARPGMEVWQITETEAKQISDPLANMIAKSEKLSTAGEYADAVALVTACLMIFIPRWFMWAEMNKAKKIKQNGGAVLVNQKGKSSGDSGKSAGKDARPAETHADSIFATIPALI